MAGKRPLVHDLVVNTAVIVVTFGSMEVLMQLKDPSSRLRLWIADGADRARAAVSRTRDWQKIEQEMQADLDIILEGEQNG